MGVKVGEGLSEAFPDGYSGAFGYRFRAQMPGTIAEASTWDGRRQVPS